MKKHENVFALQASFIKPVFLRETTDFSQLPSIQYRERKKVLNASKHYNESWSAMLI